MEYASISTAFLFKHYGFRRVGVVATSDAYAQTGTYGYVMRRVRGVMVTVALLIHSIFNRNELLLAHRVFLDKAANLSLNVAVSAAVEKEAAYSEFQWLCSQMKASGTRIFYAPMLSIV